MNAFNYFGGVPNEILTDNMKTVVVGREAGKVIWNTQFSDFAVDIGFVPKVCRVRTPQTKGKVERLVRYVKENFFPGRHFTDLNDLNLQVLNWCRNADSKTHGTTGKIPLTELASEHLQPLPEQMVLDRYRWETRTVTREGLVSFDGIRYGVPWQYSGKEVQVRLYKGNLEIYYNEILLAKHPAQHRAGNIVWLQGQYRGLAERHGIAVPNTMAFRTTTQVFPILYRNLCRGVAQSMTSCWEVSTMVDLEHARALLEDMGLHTAAELLDAQAEKSMHGQHTYVQFLNELLTSEQQERKRKSEETRLKLAKLPNRKTLDEFDFSFQPSIDKRQFDELQTLAFAARSENVILLGPPGVGKTHLAVGLALKALEAGLVVYYTTLPHLIADLKKAQEQNRLERRWRVYLRPAVLVIDEVGYMQLSRQEAELLFRLISERYEHGSIILTSNKYFSDWGELLSDNVLATALLDRLLHHAQVINIRGQTYRLRDRLKAGVLPVPAAEIPANM